MHKKLSPLFFRHFLAMLPIFSIIGCTTVSSDNSVCWQALTLAGHEWDVVHSAGYVDEAKRRGFTVEKCRVLAGLRNSAPQQSSLATAVPPRAVLSGSTQYTVHGLNATSLCKRALNPARTDFDTMQVFAAEVTEAKNRSLTVGACRTLLGLSAVPPKPVSSTGGAATASSRDAWCAVPAKKRAYPLADQHCKRGEIEVSEADAIAVMKGQYRPDSPAAPLEVVTPVMPTDPDDAQCVRLGFKLGTDTFLSCRGQLVAIREQQRQYELQKAQYEAQLAAYQQAQEDARREAQSQRMMQFGLAIAGMGNNRAAPAPVIQPPPQQPTLPRTNITLPNGSWMTCQSRGQDIDCW